MKYETISMKSFQSISKWWFYLILLPIVLGVSTWQGWAWWSWASAPVEVIESGAEAGEKPVQIKIAQGTSAQQIGKDLETAGLIRSRQAWNFWSRWLMLRDAKGEFKAGTYQISPTQPLKTIADKIWRGEVMQISFTIPEGWSLRQMADYFESQGFFKADEFMTAASQIPQDQYPWLPNGLPHLEGFLFPDTYSIVSEQITPQAIVKQMLERFEKVALPIYQEGKSKTQFNLQEWVTLASIVEKEAVVQSERTRIAGVFVARLQKGMPLGADPTVEYGLGIKQTADRTLTLAQVKTPSPYNTYINPGLTPTPIASPGLASLQATLEPEKTDFLYFVARYDGTHVFSRTLAEHEAAQAKIQDERKSRPASGSGN